VVGGKPHQLEELRHPLRALLRRLADAVDDEGLGDDVPTVIRGFRELKGSWKMICIRRR
jgi:hypothetical protein